MDCPNIKYIPNFKNLEWIGCSNCPKLTFAPTHLLKNDQETLYIIENNYQKYRKEGCKQLVNTILEELIARTWEPIRAMKWCWDDEEKRFMSDYKLI
jgi:hypothetical protein